MHHAYFCNRTTVLFNFWSRRIGVEDFVDADLEVTDLSRDSSEGHPKEREPRDPEHVHSTVTTGETGGQADTVEQKIELRMPNTEYHKWEIQCLNMSMPVQAAMNLPSTLETPVRSRMVSISWNDQTLSQPQK